MANVKWNDLPSDTSDDIDDENNINDENNIDGEIKEINDGDDNNDIVHGARFVNVYENKHNYIGEYLKNANTKLAFLHECTIQTHCASIEELTMDEMVSSLTQYGVNLGSLVFFFLSFIIF